MEPPATEESVGFGSFVDSGVELGVGSTSFEPPFEEVVVFVTGFFELALGLGTDEEVVELLLCSCSFSSFQV